MVVAKDVKIKESMYRWVMFMLCLVLMTTAWSSNQELKNSSSNHNEQNRAINLLLERAQTQLNQNLDSASWNANAALYMSKQQHLPLETARAFSLKGEIFQKHGDYTASISSYLNAIKIGEQNDYLAVLGSAYNGIGITYYLMQDLKQAEIYIRKALDVKLKQKDYIYYSIIASNLAALLVYENKNEEALTLLKTAERVAENNKLPQYLPNIYNSMGAIYFQMKNAPDSALYYYRKTIELAEKNGIQQNVITGYHNIGQLLLEKKQFTDALTYLRKGEQLSEAMNALPFMLKMVQTIAETFEAAGDIKQALVYKKKEQELTKKLFDSERQKAIEELQIQYETAKKDKINLAQERKLIQGTRQAEQAKTRFYLLLFSTLLILFAALAIFYVIYQRRVNKEKINQEKIRIFENVVHDIRTPLTLIHGPLQELKTKYQSENEEQKYFDLIDRNSEKLMRMVDELLDVSKMDKGKYQVAWTNGNLKAYLESLIHDFEREAQEKQIRLLVHLEFPDSHYRFSKDILEKIVFNLLSNALKYAPQNSDVQVDAEVEQAVLKIRVQDAGRGIAPKDQQKIFERFYRLKEHQNLPGTGIGLAVVKEFVELLGGSIKVESEINRGACFEIALPVEKSPILETSSSEDIDPDKMQLLVCDDDADILTFVRSILVHDFTIYTATNGLEAIQVIEENAPDAILSDVVMPELDGIGLLEKIKSDALLRSIPVVLFSAKSALESRLTGLQAGADYYLPKPFNPEELKLILRNITNKIEKNRSDFQHQKAEKKPFTERLRSENDYVNKATAFVIENIDNAAYSVNELAADMCISRSQLHRKLTLYTGNSATQFIRMIRLEKAKDLLESNFGNVEEIAFACGFSSRSYFSSSFAEYFGKAPSEVMGRI